MIGSLLLAVPTASGWRYAGKVGTGFTDRMLVDLAAMLSRLHTDESPITEPPPGAGVRAVRCVRPEVVGEVVTARSPGMVRCGIHGGDVSGSTGSSAI